MHMIRRLFLFLLGVAIFLVIGGFLLPKSVQTERDIVIEESPERLFAVLDGFEHFPRWSPWIVNRPATRHERSGPERGPGAQLNWYGPDSDAGDGRLVVTKVDAPHRVELELELQQRYRSDSWFALEPVPNGTRVRWGMHMEFGTFDLVGRYLGLMLPGLVGRDYQQGLESLKTYIESGAVDQDPA